MKKIRLFAIFALVASIAAGSAVAVETETVPVRDAAEPDHLQASDRLVQGTGARDGRLEPRYEAPPPEEPRRYNSDYMFGMTRGVADSTMHAAVKGPLFLLTVPLDFVLLPVTAIAGIFG